MFYLFGAVQEVTAQTETVTIRVQTASKTPATNVTVILRSSKGSTFTGITNERGIARLEGVPVGDYEIEADVVEPSLTVSRALTDFTLHQSNQLKGSPPSPPDAATPAPAAGAAVESGDAGPGAEINDSSTGVSDRHVAPSTPSPEGAALGMFERRMAALENAQWLWIRLGTLSMATLFVLFGGVLWYVRNQLIRANQRIERRKKQVAELHLNVLKHDERFRTFELRLLTAEQRAADDRGADFSAEGSVQTVPREYRIQSAPDARRAGHSPSLNSQFISPADNIWQSDVFYADMPDRQRGFPVDRLSREIGKYSLYEIQAHPNAAPATSASLTLCQNPEAHQIAMADHRDFLMSACEYQDFPTANDTRIELVRPGRVTLEGDRWHIADKIQIRFS